MRRRERFGVGVVEKVDVFVQRLPCRATGVARFDTSECTLFKHRSCDRGGIREHRDARWLGGSE